MKKIFMISLIVIGCVPPETESPSMDMVSNAYLEDCDPCDLLLNFASSNYQNSDWRGAVDNYKQLLACNCGSVDPENTFKYMAYSFQQLGLLDSAAYVFDQGLKYTPDDMELLKMAGKNAGRAGKFESQIYYFDKILIMEENNIEVLELLSEVYRKENMFEEQINIIDIWLKYDKGNKQANAEKKAAFEALGRDVSDVDKERWESETSNIQYGIDYIVALKNSDENEKIVEVANELLIYDKYNDEVLIILAEAYQNLYQEKNALEIYQELMKIDPTNYKVALEISKILLVEEDFQNAFNWAEKAIKISNNRSEALYQRAEVYFSVAESCSNDPLQFWDKIVYEISWKNYELALIKGFKQAKVRKDFLEENYITTSADWFMRPDNENSVKPQGECYDWINETVGRKK